MDNNRSQVLMSTMDTEEIIAHVAWYYYNDGLTQGKIAKMLGISRIRVSRLLEMGRQNGLIQVRINSQYQGCLQLQQDLVKTFGLIEARVIPALEEARPGPRVGMAAAEILIRKLEERDLLAVGWGEAVTTVLKRLSPLLGQKTISLVSLTGGVSAYVDGFANQGLSNNIHLIPTPLRVTSPDFAKMLRDEPSVKNVLAMALTARIALVGIGSVTRNATLVNNGYCTSSEIDLFAHKGAVGDLLGYFYDKDGHILSLELHNHVVAVQLDELKRIPTIIGAAAGHDKIDAILGALYGRLINMLVTDETTAKELLRRENEKLFDSD